jgi:ribosomal protein L11 methylase PrmA
MTTLEIIAKLSILGICVILILVWFVYAFLITFNSAPFLPSSGKKVRKALGLAGINNKTRFIDIGSGDGRVVLHAAKLGAELASGVEINPYLSLLSRCILWLNGRRNAQILQANMFKLDYSSYNVIYAYLLPATMNKLLPIIKQQVKPGTVVISNTFKFADKTPEQVVDNIYLYRF